MKRLVMMGSVIALMGSMGLADPAPSGSGSRHSDLRESCRQIEAACIDAGFAIGVATPKGKRLYKDCMLPVMDGKTVRGVTIDPLVVEACRARGRTGK
jgi:hypothetical protein